MSYDVDRGELLRMGVMSSRAAFETIRGIPRLGVALWLLVVITVPAVPALDQPIQPIPWVGASRSWYADRDGPEAKYVFDDVTLTISAVQDPGSSGPRLDAVAKNGAKITLFGKDSSRVPHARFNVLRLDPEHSTIDVLFASDTGGAHCCADIKVLSLFGESWKLIDLGQWDGDTVGVINQPREVTDDGKLEFVRGDDRFRYTFGVEAPLQILRVEDGIVLDVSAQQQFNNFHFLDMKQHEQKCEEGRNGACAAFVASAIRAGDYDRAWNYMLEHYDRNDKHGLEMHQTEYGAGCTLPLVFSDFPKALDWFLTDTGYLQKGR
jgi:hypothetical protein